MQGLPSEVPRRGPLLKLPDIRLMSCHPWAEGCSRRGVSLPGPYLLTAHGPKARGALPREEPDVPQKISSLTIL